jgi:hypothetical protein
MPSELQWRREELGGRSADTIVSPLSRFGTILADVSRVVHRDVALLAVAANLRCRKITTAIIL